MRTMTRSLLVTALIGLTVSCAPFGEGIVGAGGASSSFSSVGVPVPGGSPDMRAQELLMNAFDEAMVVSIDSGSFAELDTQALLAMDPSTRVAGDVPARVGVVSIDLASADGLVMSTKSRSGKSLCIAAAAPSLGSFAGPSGGTVDADGATSVADCTGRDWVSNP